jgi:hypothetical protein
VWASIDSLRSIVNARIRAALPGERGEIAAALITGERAGISKDDNQAMRSSGLFHILSISGLHMVIMAGTVFWVVRALLTPAPSTSKVCRLEARASPRREGKGLGCRSERRRSRRFPQARPMPVTRPRMMTPTTIAASTPTLMSELGGPGLCDVMIIEHRPA